MRPFEYSRATDQASALASLQAAPHTAVLAGGTTLIDLMKLGVMQPERVVDITALPGSDSALAAITQLPDGGVHIGALARMSDVAEHPLIVSAYRVVHEALLKGASAQLRNMATIGGNLLQRTRCTYFRDVTMPACNKRQPGSGCGARQGVHRLSAILGGSEACIATHPSDVAMAFVALDAQVHCTDGQTEQVIPATEFFLPPGETPWQETTLPPGSLITAVTLPPLPAQTRSHYLKVRDRESYEFALASAAGALVIENGVITFARLAMGGVGTIPWRASAAEALLLGGPANQAQFATAAQLAVAGAQPLAQNAFKVPLAQQTVLRVLTTLATDRSHEGAS